MGKGSLEVLGLIADDGEMNEQEEVMKKGNEKGKVVGNGVSGIKKERLKILRGAYQKPMTSDFQVIDISKEHSNMAQCLPASWAL